MHTQENEELLNEFLNDQNFKNTVINDIGPLTAPIMVDWENNIIHFYGQHNGKTLQIDETLEFLKNGTELH